MHKTLDLAAYKSYKIWQQHYVVSCFRMLPQKYCIILDKKATGDQKGTLQVQPAQNWFCALCICYKKARDSNPRSEQELLPARLATLETCGARRGMSTLPSRPHTRVGCVVVTKITWQCRQKIYRYKWPESDSFLPKIPNAHECTRQVLPSTMSRCLCVSDTWQVSDQTPKTPKTRLETP